MQSVKSKTRLTSFDITTIKIDIMSRDNSISIEDGTACRKMNNKEFIKMLINSTDLNPLTVWYMKACSYLDTVDIDLRQVDNNIKQLKKLKLI